MGRFNLRVFPGLVMILVVLNICCSHQGLSKGHFTINADEASRLIAENSGNADFVVIDVRTEDEYKEGHVKGALNIDYYDGRAKEKLDAMDKTKTYLIYCASGSRSSIVLEMMQELGFSSVYNVRGTMVDYFEGI